VLTSLSSNWNSSSLGTVFILICGQRIHSIHKRFNIPVKTAAFSLNNLKLKQCWQFKELTHGASSSLWTAFILICGRKICNIHKQFYVPVKTAAFSLNNLEFGNWSTFTWPFKHLLRHSIHFGQGIIPRVHGHVSLAESRRRTLPLNHSILPGRKSMVTPFNAQKKPRGDKNGQCDPKKLFSCAIVWSPPPKKKTSIKKKL
jgi:hypothetical protein